MQIHFKKVGTTGLAIAGVLGLFAGGISPAHADKAARGWNGFTGPHGSSDKAELGSDGSSSISNSILVGIRVWQRLGEMAAAELELPLGVTDSRDHIATLFVTMPRAQLRVFPLGIQRLTPSLVVGAGVPIVTSTKQSSVASDLGFATYAGAALDLRHKRFRIGLEARYIATPASNEASSSVAHEWELLLNLGWVPAAKQQGREVEPEVVLDKDRDGVADDDDKCPDRAEDLDGFQDEDGCPELDNDGDGVIDGLDDCPKEAEDFNGFEDDDGCSDVLPGEVRLLEGVISGLRFDEGSGVMDEAGREELLRLTALLRDFPSIKIELVGHADAKEVEPELRHKLSLERADSVRQLMVELGIGHGRVFSFGKSDKEPFDSNESARGRRENRRVELRILRGEPAKERSIEDYQEPDVDPASQEDSEVNPVEPATEPKPDEAPKAGSKAPKVAPPATPKAPPN